MVGWPWTGTDRRLFSTSLNCLRSPPSHLVNWLCGSFPGIHRPDCEADYSPPHNADTQNECSRTSTSSNSFTASTWVIYLYVNISELILQVLRLLAVNILHPIVLCPVSDRSEVTLPKEYVNIIRHKLGDSVTEKKTMKSHVGHVL
jgi:hypothetical protein